MKKVDPLIVEKSSAWERPGIAYGSTEPDKVWVVRSAGIAA